MNEPDSARQHRVAGGQAGEASPRDVLSRTLILPVARVGVRAVVLVGLAWLVWHELRAVDLATAGEHLRAVDRRLLGLALTAVVLGVSMAGLYDVLVFRSLPELGRAKRWLLGMLAFAWTNFLSLGPLGGPALRLFMYRRYGLSTGEVMRGMVHIYAGTLGGIGGWAVASLLPMGNVPHSAWWRAPVAMLLSPMAAAMIGLIGRWLGTAAGTPMSARATARLGLLGAVDWGLAMAAFVIGGWAVGARAPVAAQIQAVTLGYAVGHVSMMPGGLGSADAVWLKMLTAAGVETNVALAQVLLFRCVYFLLPWTCSLLALYARFAGAGEAMLDWQRRILAAAVGINGLLLLGSAASADIARRTQRLHDWLPVDPHEVSRLLAILAGTGMLFLVRGIVLGYRSAFFVVAAALAAALGAHMLKGLRLPEMLMSLLLLVLVLHSRHGFTRRGRVPLGWELSLGLTAGSLVFFLLVGQAAFPVFRHSDLWELYQRAMRDPEVAAVVRGSGLVLAAGVVFILWHAFSPTRRAMVPTPAEIEQALTLVERYGERASALALAAGDAGLWFWSRMPTTLRPDQGLALVQRRHGWLLVLGDPVVADRARADDLLEDLQAYARDQGLSLALYGIGSFWTDRLSEFGYRALVFAGEAVVRPTGAGSASGVWDGDSAPESDEPVQVVRHEPPLTARVLEEAGRVSDAWLDANGLNERQWAVGYFAPGRARRWTMFAVRDARGHMRAFASVLTLRGREVAFDLVRCEGEAARWTVVPLVRAVAAWAGTAGYARLSLGLMPLHDAHGSEQPGVRANVAAMLRQHARAVWGPAQWTLGDAARRLGAQFEPRALAVRRPWDWPGAIMAATSLIQARTAHDRMRLAALRAGS